MGKREDPRGGQSRREGTLRKLHEILDSDVDPLFISNEFTDLYEIWQYYSSSNPIALQRQQNIFCEPLLEIPCLIDISDGTRIHFDIRKSKCNAPSTVPKCFPVSAL